MAFGFKDLISIKQLSAEDILNILERAREMRNLVSQPNKKSKILEGKSVVNLFYENSTRTRTSFELAGKYLSADVVHIAANTSSVAKGESLVDTAKTLDRLKPDVIVMRHPSSGAHELVAKNVNAHVLNAGDGTHEHPTQALLDALTISDYKKFSGLKVLIVGDISHSRVARSNILLLTKLGCEVVVCGPATLLPQGISQMGCTVEYDFDKAVCDADVIMMLRIQLERQKAQFFPSKEEYAHFYCLTEERLAKAKPDAIILHPGPINRGLEIAPRVADCSRSLINEQVTNGLSVRMALLAMITEEA